MKLQYTIKKNVGNVPTEILWAVEASREEIELYPDKVQVEVYSRRIEENQVSTTFFIDLTGINSTGSVLYYLGPEHRSFHIDDSEVFHPLNTVDDIKHMLKLVMEKLEANLVVAANNPAIDISETLSMSDDTKRRIGLPVLTKKMIRTDLMIEGGIR